MTYELHPLCTLFPRLGAAEFDSLTADIKANGLREMIVLHEGMILDGGNRYRACQEAEVEPQFIEFAGGNLASYVLSVNLHRRHLSAGQQAAIVASTQNWANAQARGGDRKSDQSATLHFDSVSKRAAESGASLRTQKMADKVAKADPELARKVGHGTVSLPKAVAQVSGQPARKEKRQLPEPAPKPDQTDNLRAAVESLSEANDELTQRLAVKAMEATDEEKGIANDLIAELRAQVKQLKAENHSLKSLNDGLLVQNGEMKQQIAYWKRRAEKVAA